MGDTSYSRLPSELGDLKEIFAMTYTFSDDLLTSDDTEESTYQGTYTKLKEFTIPTGVKYAKFRIKFDIKSGHNTLAQCKAKIYKNGVGVGTEQTAPNTAWVNKSEDLDVYFKTADTLELWIYTTNTIYSAYCRNFRVYGAINDTYMPPYVINMEDPTW